MGSNSNTIDYLQRFSPVAAIVELSALDKDVAATFAEILDRGF
jgi:hypothetical protein